MQTQALSSAPNYGVQGEKIHWCASECASVQVVRTEGSSKENSANCIVLKRSDANVLI